MKTNDDDDDNDNDDDDYNENDAMPRKIEILILVS